MLVFDSLDEFPFFDRPIVTIGTFDGVHLGHQEILKKIVQKAHSQKKKSVLFTFHPHPRTVLDPENHQVKLIDCLNEKLAKLEKIGLDAVILFPFSVSFSSLNATDFTVQILVEKLDASEIHVGYDHHFGKDRSGDFIQLKQLGSKLNFDVYQTDAITIGKNAISSTKIRNALLEGNIALANEFLGRAFELNGSVIHGNKLGRTIGFPTANVEMNDPLKIIPKKGVYSARIKVKDTWFKAVLNIGNKPTVQNTDTIYVEVFIFDFSSDIYGEEVRIEIYDYLRAEQKFDSLESLKTQLKNDETQARILLALRVFD